MVNTDSFHIKDEDKTYRCEVGLSTYLAPEIQKKLVNGLTLKMVPLPTYSKETDLFSLAIHIFCLIMDGCHPFACAKRVGNSYTHNMEALNSENEDSVVLPQPIENIRNGFFPFLHEMEGVTFPLYAPDMKKLPKDLYEMFIKAFDLGYFTSSERPTAKEWMRILSAYQGPAHFMKCSNGHYYLKENTSFCPFCDEKQRMNQMISGTENKDKRFTFEDILTKTEYFEFEIGGYFQGHSIIKVKKSLDVITYLT